ncbi:hypothetical protein DVB69_10740 [Sporosarcina sp. BI001-red]|nr:hypothetical protein DVB69_10740 [Sporosarcina sp. BI001-red]
MRASLELLRIFIILLLFGSLGWAIVKNIYSVNQVDPEFIWMGAIAILVLFFVLYRNKLQFSGWYNGKGKEKLTRAVSLSLIALAFLLFLTPFIISSL